MALFVEVIVDIATKALDRPFTYQVPNDLDKEVMIGSLVVIPFGKNNRLINGYVIEIKDQVDPTDYALKSIVSISDEISVESELIALAYFMARRYIANLQLSLNAMIPAKQEIAHKTTKIIKKNISIEALKLLIDGILDQPRFDKRRRLLEYLLEHPEATFETLQTKLAIEMPMIKSLEKKGIIIIQEKESYRNPFTLSDTRTVPLEPNPEQKIAIKRVQTAIINQQSQVFLLHGKTGTGKTEVYMQIIDQVLRDKKACIVLIPEIGLTPQTLSRFLLRFGDQVGVMHSKLSPGEKYDQWRKAKEGKISIMIGPRSAVFAPFSRIGAIIIDESHETTYKSDTNPKYHAREIAIKRSDYHKCPVVLGTATPLVENYAKALEGKYQLLSLKQRFSTYKGPAVEVVDMREELEKGNTDIFSELLREAIKKRLENKEQTILFINRRGHSNFVSCRKCGHVLKCESCDIPYTYHSSVNRLICHYCGKTEKMVTKCPVCESTYIKTFGVGTQQVEKRLYELYPDIRITRMDFDTTSKKNGHENLLKAFGDFESDVLIGTQMVAKGHHFDRVTLVGVVAADMSLYIDDFRAAEKTFQLLNQVSGRAGRGQLPGESIIQTYTPEHMSIRYAQIDDYEAFYQEEIQMRNLLGNPPFSTLMKVMIQGESEKTVIKTSNQLIAELRPVCYQLNIKVIGPSPASVSKIRKKYRWQIMFKSNQYKEMQQLAFHINDMKMKYLSDKLMTIGLDINPMSM